MNPDPGDRAIGEAARLRRVKLGERRVSYLLFAQEPQKKK